MRTDEDIAREISYLHDTSDSPKNVNVYALIAELLLDLRTIALMPIKGVLPVEVEEKSDTEGVQPAADDSGVPEGGVGEPG